MSRPFPTQALTLLNDDFVLRQAKLFADRVAEAAPNDPAKQIDLAYRIALSRPPGAKEMDMGMEFLKKQSLVDFTHVLLNLNEFSVRAVIYETILVETRFPVSILRRHERPGAAHLLNQDGLLAASVNDAACDSKPVGYNPYAPKKPHFAAARQERDLAVHERRRQPPRHVRSEARAGQIRRAAAHRQGRDRRAAGAIPAR